MSHLNKVIQAHRDMKTHLMGVLKYMRNDFFGSYQVSSDLPTDSPGMVMKLCRLQMICIQW